MKTPAEYLASLAQMKHNVWMNGRKVDRPWEHPQIIPGVNIVCLTYQWPLDHEHHASATATSHINGKTINRFTHIHQSTDDLSKYAGLLMVASVHGGGSPEAERKAILRSYDIESRKQMARRAAGIAV